MNQTATAKAFISGRAACQLGEMNRNELMKLVALGRIATRALPGTTMKFSAVDVERVKAERAASK